jgi:hypothetical protein
MSKKTGKLWLLTTALVLTLLLLTSMTGCAKRYVVVNGDETVQVKKSTLDNLYSDNELLLKALEECRVAK